MTRRSLGLMLSLVLMFAVAAASGRPARASAFAVGGPAVSGSAPNADRGTSVDQQGRYKKQGDNCVWDANDGGPNQCTPQVKGRFKRGANDSCTGMVPPTSNIAFSPERTVSEGVDRLRTMPCRSR